ncbi:hypothetical protein TIFTF001_008247 [Ficus carica]|uniref:Uncharacterized protein n=1 Tax=Ficus carica TaxID=3494 RepID=A0AA87ZMP1_FICCA|nr:hypothetical protein TIFTF001_008247 [Ficus carica]
MLRRWLSRSASPSAISFGAVGNYQRQRDRYEIAIIDRRRKRPWGGPEMQHQQRQEQTGSGAI